MSSSDLDAHRGVVVAAPVATAAIDNDPLVAWISQQFEMLLTGHRVHEVRLCHLGINDNQTLMTRFQVQTHDHVTARNYTMQLRVLAERDAELRGHRERYAVIAIWPGSTPDEWTYTQFAVDGARQREMQLGSSEPATLEGVTKQQMRHNEVLMKLMTRTVLDNQEFTSRLLSEQQLRIKELEGGRLKTLELAESLMNAQAEREMEARREAAAESRRAIMLKEFTDVLPAVKMRLLQGVTGHKMSDAKSVEVQQLQIVFRSMPFEMLMAMIGTLPPQQQLVMTQLYASLMGVSLTPENHAEAHQKFHAEQVAALSSAAAAVGAPPSETPSGGGDGGAH